MGKEMKSIIKKMLSSSGLEIRKHKLSHSTEETLSLWLKNNEIEYLIDVGANYGQFAKKTMLSGYQGKILSFEPLPLAHEQLLISSKGFTNWIVAPRMALGKEIGEITINESRNSVSSSILSMLPAHLNSAPESEYISKSETVISTLDAVLTDYFQPSTSPAFLKVDTQGYEWNVLQGGIQVLASLKGILLEFSTIPLYEGQVLYLQMINFLEEQGFRLFHLSPNFADETTGRVLQFDAIFVKE